MNDSVHVRVEGVRHTYGRGRGAIEAIRAASFAARYGEFISLLGPSGCGKSSLLLMVGGLIQPTGGRVSVDGTVVAGPRRGTGMVFQSPLLLPWRSVLDNVLLPIELLKLDRRTFQDRARQLLEMTGLREFERRLPHELSGGMQQRVAICRGLVQEPNLLLMDEPFSALDAMTRDEMNRELLRIWEQQRVTVLFVTHSIREAVYLSDRVLVMTQRPSVIRDDIRIDLPRPRNIEIEESAEFNRYCAILRRLIEHSHHNGPALTDETVLLGSAK
ncbi:MAG: ABC transporter ATP-binding protein [Chloroflexi bacterium]|nr:ABC transporter ATP-binding protein [Chloroflexota bacterium]